MMSLRSRDSGYAACERDSGDHEIDRADPVALLAELSLYPNGASSRLTVVRNHRHLLHGLRKTGCGRGIAPHADSGIDERRNRQLSVGNLVECRYCGVVSCEQIDHDRGAANHRWPSIRWSTSSLHVSDRLRMLSPSSVSPTRSRAAVDPTGCRAAGRWRH